jgi:hypothetical protein
MATTSELPLVAVVLAIHRPDAARLARLLASIRAQQDVAVRIFATVDGPAGIDAGGLALLESEDIALTLGATHRGVRETFMAGLAAALAWHPEREPRGFAFADQDDVWHPAKLRTLLAALTSSGAGLVHCDARVVTADGGVLAPSLHRLERRRPAATLRDCLVLNSVSGMTSLFTGQVARLALRLGADSATSFLHDHVTAIAAAAQGGTIFIDQPLVDYVQHESNVMGARPRETPGRGLAILQDAGAYRAQSLAAFTTRRDMVLALRREGFASARLERLFLADTGATAARLAWDYLGSAAAYSWHGQAQRAFMCMRLLDGALMFRRQTARAAGSAPVSG